MAPHFYPVDPKDPTKGCYAVVQKRHVMTDDEVMKLYRTKGMMGDLNDNRESRKCCRPNSTRRGQAASTWTTRPTVKQLRHETNTEKARGENELPNAFKNGANGDVDRRLGLAWYRQLPLENSRLEGHRLHRYHKPDGSGNEREGKRPAKLRGAASRAGTSNDYAIISGLGAWAVNAGGHMNQGKSARVIGHMKEKTGWEIRHPFSYGRTDDFGETETTDALLGGENTTSLGTSAHSRGVNSDIGSRSCVP